MKCKRIGAVFDGFSRKSQLPGITLLNRQPGSSTWSPSPGSRTSSVKDASGRSKNTCDLVRNLRDRGHSVDRAKLTLGVVVTNQRCGLLVILTKALLEHFRVIVLANLLPGGLGLLGALQDPVHQDLVVDDQFNHGIKPGAAFGKHRIDGISLNQRTRVAIEDETLGAVSLVDPLSHDRVDDLVGDELACVHDRLGALANLSLSFHCSAQNVARGKLRYTQPFNQDLRLRPLACSGRSQKN